MIIALDIGTQKTGIAKEIEGVVFPETIVPTKDVVTYLQNRSDISRVSRIVIGFSKHHDGSFSRVTHQIFRMKKTLEHLFPSISITLYDESYTSQEASLAYMEVGVEVVGKLLDDLAASALLSHYLFHVGNTH